MIEKIKSILGITDTSKDAILTILIANATAEAEIITHGGSVSDYTIIQMVCFAYGKLGSEGLESESYSGLSFNYLEDLPEEIMRQLRAVRRVGVIK